MASRVLSIELGQSMTRICEIDHKVKKPKVYSSLEIATPEGAVEDGFVLQPKELAKEITKAIKDAGLKTKKVVFTITSGRIASREATLPYVKLNKLPELVEAAAGDYFPVDLSECKVTYQVLDVPQEEDGTKKYRLSLLIAPNELLESYYGLAAECGLEIVALDHAVNSITTVLKEELTTGVRMVINTNETNTQLFIFDEGNIVLARTIPTGVGMMIEAAQKPETEESGAPLSYLDAVKKLRSQVCIKTERDVAAREVSPHELPAEEFRVEVTEALGNIGASIQRVMDYYNSRNVDRIIENVYLTGFAEDFLGFLEYLAEELGVEIGKMADMGGKDLEFGGEKHIGSFIACVGAAMESLDLIPDSHLEKKKKKAKKKADASDKAEQAAGSNKQLLIGIAVMLAGFIVAGALAGYSLTKYDQANTKNKELKQREAELLPILGVYKENVRAGMVYEDVKSMYDSTLTQNDNLSAFLQELERKLPSNVNVLSFSVTQEAVSLNMNVDSKEAAARTIDEFRKFDSLSDVHVSGLAEETDELGLSSLVNFTIDCTYAPIIMEDELSEPEAQADGQPETQEQTEEE